MNMYENENENGNENGNENEKPIDLDISWIDKNQKLHNIEQNYIRENMDSISVYYFYMNQDNFIEKIVCEKEPLIQHPKNGMYISKERFLQMIQTKKCVNVLKKYKMMDACLYNVILEPKHIQEYAQSICENEVDNIMCSPFFKTLPIVDDIILEPSIFIFHSINGLFVFFRELETIKPVLRPILKIGGNGIKKHTKKVRIFDENNCDTDNIVQNTHVHRHHKTRRAKPSL